MREQPFSALQGGSTQRWGGTCCRLMRCARRVGGLSMLARDGVAMLQVTLLPMLSFTPQRVVSLPQRRLLLPLPLATKRLVLCITGCIQTICSCVCEASTSAVSGPLLVCADARRDSGAASLY